MRGHFPSREKPAIISYSISKVNFAFLVTSSTEKRRRGTESIKYTPQIGSVTLVKNGDRVWQKSRRFGPMGMIQLKRGESAQAAAKRLCKPDPSFFESVAIPKYISQLPGGEPLGRSTISEKGVN
ncbi:MAG: hypothetical protein ACPIA2_18490 [Mariniblastus sp.]